MEELTRQLVASKNEMEECARGHAVEMAKLKVDHDATLQKYKVSLLEIQDYVDSNFKLGVYQTVYVATKKHDYSDPPASDYPLSPINYPVFDKEYAKGEAVAQAVEVGEGPSNASTEDKAAKAPTDSPAKDPNTGAPIDELFK